MSFFGPGGGYAPRADVDWHLLVGDESALPAIAAALEQIPPAIPVRVFVEVADEAERQDLPTAADAEMTWVYRSSGDADLVGAVTSATWPAGQVQAFIHGDAELVREIRRYLRREQGLTPEFLSASGYWRRGRTDEAWRAEKRAWLTEVETDDAALDSGRSAGRGAA